MTALTRLISLAAAFALAAMAAGCATQPKSRAQELSLEQRAEGELQAMRAEDPSLGDLLDRAHGYAIFPDVGKAGLIAGAASGQGVVYEQGEPIGYATLNQASIGAQIGAQSYSELVVFENENALARLKSGDIDFGADVSAVALKAGAARQVSFQGGMAVFVKPRGGLMASVAVAGQNLSYKPMRESAREEATERQASSSTRPATRHSESGEMREVR